MRFIGRKKSLFTACFLGCFFTFGCQEIKQFIPNDKDVISATTDYSSNIVCSIEKENIFGTQFHPEKSDKMGLKIIDNFLNL